LGGRWGSSGMEKKFESETFKQLIGGSTVSYACSMQGYKYEYWKADTLIICDINSFRRAL
jgi:hypothetical protein